MELKSVLVFEPSVDGHHVGWLRFITEDLLAAGCSLTLALRGRQQWNASTDKCPICCRV